MGKRSQLFLFRIIAIVAAVAATFSGGMAGITLAKPALKPSFAPVGTITPDSLDLYRAGQSDKQVEAIATLLYDCGTQEMTVHVNTVSGVTLVKSPGDHFVKIDGNKPAPDVDVDDGDTSWEVTFELEPGSYDIQVHTQVSSDDEEQTATNDGRDSSLTIECPAETPTTEPTAETPTTEPTAETPTTEPTAETPTTEPTAETPTTEPTAETPTASPTTKPKPDAPGTPIGQGDKCVDLNLDNIPAGTRLKSYHGLTFTAQPRASKHDMIIYPTGAGWPDEDLNMINIGNVFAFVPTLTDADGNGLVDPTGDSERGGDLIIESGYKMNVANIIFGDIEYGEDIKVEFYGDSGLIKTVMGPKTGNGGSFESSETVSNVTRIVWYSRNSSVIKFDLTCTTETTPTQTTPTETTPIETTPTETTPTQTTPTETTPTQTTPTETTPTETTPTQTTPTQPSIVEQPPVEQPPVQQPPVQQPPVQQPPVQPPVQQPPVQQPPVQQPVVQQPAPAGAAAPAQPARNQAVAGVTDEEATDVEVESSPARPRAVLGATGMADAGLWLLLTLALLFVAIGSGVRVWQLQLRRN